MAINSALLNDLAPLEISFSIGLSSSDHDFMLSFLWLMKIKVKKKDFSNEKPLDIMPVNQLQTIHMLS